jgi:hypothetical protein
VDSHPSRRELEEQDNITLPLLQKTLDAGLIASHDMEMLLGKMPTESPMERFGNWVKRLLRL